MNEPQEHAIRACNRYLHARICHYLARNLERLRGIPLRDKGYRYERQAIRKDVAKEYPYALFYMVHKDAQPHYPVPSTISTDTCDLDLFRLIQAGWSEDDWQEFFAYGG